MVKEGTVQLLNIAEKRLMKDCRSQSIEEVKNCRAEKSKIYCEFYNYFMTTTIYYLFCRQINFLILAFVMV